MRHTIQCWTELGNFANPRDHDDKFTGTLKECKKEFATWYKMHLNYYEEREAQEALTGLVWIGDTVGDYPDFLLKIGPRGGVRRCAS